MSHQKSNNYCGGGLPPYNPDRDDAESGFYSDITSVTSISSASTTIDNRSVYSAAATYGDTTVYVSSSRANSEYGAVTSIQSSNHYESIAARPTQPTLYLRSSSIASSSAPTFTASIASGSSISYSGPLVADVNDFATAMSRTARIPDTYNRVPANFTDPATMFPAYVPIYNHEQDVHQTKVPEAMEIDAPTTDHVIVRNDTQPVLRLSYDRCCLSHDHAVGACGPTSHRYPGRTDECVTFRQLAQGDIRHYLKRIGVISKTEEDTTIGNEANLIANRLQLRNIQADDSMSICPRHRSSFGVDWYDSKSTCHHPEHDPEHRPKASDCRRATLKLSSKIPGFPVGGRLCTKHRKMEKPPAPLMSIIETSQSTNETSRCTNESMFELDNTRENMNRILAEIKISPIRSQSTTSLQHQSASGVRRLVSKLRRGVQTFQEKLAETLAPTQGTALLELAHLELSSEAQSTDNASINNEIVENLKKLYKFYVENKMPFIEQAQILSLLPRTWSYERIMETFSCTRHAIKVARQVQADNERLLQQDQEPAIRQRADPNKIRHFVSWLVESNTLVSGTYGLTTLRMDSGDSVELSKQILQCQKSHAIASYRKYCEETGFEGLCTRKLFDIVNGLKPAQQRALTGLDEFVVEGVEAWQRLSNIVSNLPIPQSIRKRLLQQINMAEQYQKTRHSGHCSANSDCSMHCTTFGLSDPKCAQHSCDCTEQHDTICTDCVNIIVTLDEIYEKINKIADEEVKCEAKYDFEQASQHIIEWSRHNIRAACQNDAKNRIISQMADDEAFCTFDWGQKILPQEYREKQSAYFGKRGMSVLVGSFVWKSSSSNTQASNSPSQSTFHTESYIVALTNAAQTDLDTLSASEIIFKQFQSDHPHVIKLHKRTDNASNFSSHSTPEGEKLICDRLGIQLLTRDYSEVQKGKDICDRVCGGCKGRLRSWMSTGNDLLNANDIKEGMEYAGGIKNTKVAVAEIVPNKGRLGKTNVPNVSTIRSIEYGANEMRVFKASKIGPGVSIPYKKIDFESNMRVISPFSESIDDTQSTMVSKKRADREHHDILMCPVQGCTSTFECSAELDSHIAANLHKIPVPKPQTSNDIARHHLVETLRSTNMQLQRDQHTIRTTQDTSNIDLAGSMHYESFSSPGWALRTRRQNNPLNQSVTSFIEEMWRESQNTRSKLTPEQVYQEIRTQRNASTGKKRFQPDEYATINQIKYQLRKLGTKQDVTAKDELIDELIEDNIENN